MMQFSYYESCVYRLMIFFMFSAVRQLLVITKKMRQDVIKDIIYSHQIEYYCSLSYELVIVHNTWTQFVVCNALGKSSHEHKLFVFLQYPFRNWQSLPYVDAIHFSGASS